MKSQMKLEEVEFEVEDGVEVDQILTELDQTKLNWALTQLKLKLVKSCLWTLFSSSKLQPGQSQIDWAQ